jgi:hypothetical protein
VAPARRAPRSLLRLAVGPRHREHQDGEEDEIDRDRERQRNPLPARRSRPRADDRARPSARRSREQPDLPDAVALQDVDDVDDVLDIGRWVGLDDYRLFAATLLLVEDSNDELLLVMRAS